MRDALGGTVVLMIIVIFIVFALGYMAFNVNYTKAFRMKNKIISVYEDYKGNCSSSECQKAITDYAKDQIKDKEIKKYYDEKIKPDIKVSHILITADVKDGMSEEEKTAKEEVAEELNMNVDSVENDLAEQLS